MTKYKLSTYKLTVCKEYETEVEAIKDLSDLYMSCSKCDPPGTGVKEQILHWEPRPVEDIGKQVQFYIEEKVYGIKQFVQKATLIIYPFKKRHWWNRDDNFKFDGRKCKFRYEVEEGEINEIINYRSS